MNVVSKKLVSEVEVLVRDAFNEGFTEGMKEFSSNRGGYSWNESRAKRALARQIQDATA